MLEVVKIDEADGKVEILNTGAPATLTLKEDTIEPGQAAGPAQMASKTMSAAPLRRHACPPLFPPPGAGMTRAGWPGAGLTCQPMRPRRTPVPQ